MENSSNPHIVRNLKFHVYQYYYVLNYGCFQSERQKIREVKLTVNAIKQYGLYKVVRYPLD